MKNIIFNVEPPEIATGNDDFSSRTEERVISIEGSLLVAGLMLLPIALIFSLNELRYARSSELISAQIVTARQDSTHAPTKAHISYSFSINDVAYFADADLPADWQQPEDRMIEIEFLPHNPKHSARIYKPGTHIAIYLLAGNLVFLALIVLKILLEVSRNEKSWLRKYMKRHDSGEADYKLLKQQMAERKKREKEKMARDFKID